MEEFFKRMDRDYDGRLSFEEFMGEETTLEKLFKNMDKNNDGVVSKQVSPKSLQDHNLSTPFSDCNLYNRSS